MANYIYSRGNTGCKKVENFNVYTEIKYLCQFSFITPTKLRFWTLYLVYYIYIRPPKVAIFNY